MVALAVMVILLLAGCAGRPAGVASGERPDRAYGGKVLHGNVMDDELQPLEGALVELDDTDLNLTTGPDGTFTFEGLEPVDYVVHVRRDGYESRSQQAAMVMGRSFELNFTLPRLPTGEPRLETATFRGFLSCAVGIRLDWPGWVHQDCGQADPNNKRSHVFSFDPHSSGMVVEMTWEPTQPCAGRLRLTMSLLVPDAQSLPIAEETLAPGQGFVLPPSYFSLRQRTGGQIGATIFADRCTDYAGFALQQPVEVLLTAFYFQPVPGGFSAIG